jgi:hypothetical protein
MFNRFTVVWFGFYPGWWRYPFGFAGSYPEGVPYEDRIWDWGFNIGPLLVRKINKYYMEEKDYE